MQFEEIYDIPYLKKYKKELFILNKDHLVKGKFDVLILIETRYSELIETNSDQSEWENIEKTVSSFINSFLTHYYIVGYNLFNFYWHKDYVYDYFPKKKIDIFPYEKGFFFKILSKHEYEQFIYNASAGAYLLFIIPSTVKIPEDKFNHINSEFLDILVKKTDFLIYENDYMGGNMGILCKDSRVKASLINKINEYLIHC